MSDILLLAPFAGWLGPLDEVADPVFAQRMMGDGLAIDPVEGVLRAPADGQVVNIADTMHAVTLRLGDGTELLLHIGLDTVALGGKGFRAEVSAGDRVAAGDPLIVFDVEAVAAAARDLVTPMVLPGEGMRITIDRPGRMVAAGEAIARIWREGNGIAAAAGTAGPTLERTITVVAPLGLHARPAARIVALLKRYAARLTLTLGERSASGSSTVALLTLAAKAGDRLEVTATGADAAAALDALDAFAADRFGDPAEAQPPAPVTAMRGAIGAAPGLAIGTIVQLRPTAVDVAAQGRGEAHEHAALDAALATVGAALAGHGTAAEIAEAHRALLDDPQLRGEATAAIVGGASAGAAWRDAIATAADALRATGDPRLAERIADLRDLERQVLVALSGEDAAATPVLPHDAIVITDDLLPSQFLALDPARLAGIVTAGGGPTAHVALLAAAAGVPMIVAAGPIVLTHPDGATAILDAGAAQLEVDPAPEHLAEVADRRARAGADAQAARRAAHEPAITADGTRIEVFANLGSIDDAAAAVRAGAEGCGLLRTEFLFLDRDTAPDEAEQRQLYARIAAMLGDRPLIVRTLDIGADKPVAYLPMPHEANPALGQRGIRLSLARPDMLAAQLRAILAGVPGDQCRIMLPMVADLGELRAARAALDEAMRDVGRRDAVRFGVMIETPAAALIAAQLAEHADFLSVGTNDLTQYALAADRANPAVSSLIDACHPAVLRLIALAAEGAAAHGRWLGVCGGLASDPSATALLVGLGVGELSAVPAALPAIKAAVRRTTMAAARDLARSALAAPDTATVRRLIAASRAGDTA